MKQFSDFDTTGFRKCQISAISKLEKYFAANKSKTLIQMAMGVGKTFTAITTVYRLLKHTGANRVRFLVDTKGLGEQAEREFLAYRPNNDNRNFAELYGVRCLNLDLFICTIFVHKNPLKVDFGSFYGLL